MKIELTVTSPRRAATARSGKRSGPRAIARPRSASTASRSQKVRPWFPEWNTPSPANHAAARSTVPGGRPPSAPAATPACRIITPSIG
jgi:hypothetical protein